MTKRSFLLTTFLLIALVARAEPITPATVLYFEEHEQGTHPYRTRIIVTAKFVRMDDGANNQDFLLFDRAGGTIYSVSSRDRQILVIRFMPVKIKPPEKLTQRVVIDHAIFPSVGRHKVIHYQLLTNNQLCYDLYAADGLLPDVVEALRLYYVALAGQQALTIPVTPAEIQSSCDLANNVFYPARQLEYGFPVRFVDMAGKTSELEGYKTNFLATAAIFRLPQDYKRLTLEELRKK
ncbi:MAG: hypothetical protein ACYC9J_03290 [Sulfuricaulis sp.]